MKQRGKRIRPSGKDLVFHFTIASLLPVFLLVVGLFHVKTIQQINWQDFNLSQADKIDIPYLIISFSVAILICLLVAFVFKRVRYDTVKQLYHRQKLAKMILENKWYESEQSFILPLYQKDMISWRKLKSYPTADSPRRRRAKRKSQVWTDLAGWCGNSHAST